jgi:hypothetical protein
MSAISVRVIRPLNEVRVIDGRPGFLLVQGQEVLTADGVALKVSLAARYVVGDPVAAVTNDQDYLRALHVELQLGLRDALSAGAVEEVLASRAKTGDDRPTTAAPRRVGTILMSSLLCRICDPDDRNAASSRIFRMSLRLRSRIASSSVLKALSSFLTPIEMS